MTIARREFLKATSAAAGATALSRVLGEHPEAGQRPEDVRITDARYRPLADYPIQPQRFSDVRLTDTFWKPKVDLNAAVTIPLEVHKFVDGEREFGGNILEAAILSLKTHPNPTLQAQVDAQIRATAQAAGRGQRRIRSRRHALQRDGSSRPARPGDCRRRRAVRGIREDESAVFRRRARCHQLRPAVPGDARQEASRPREALPGYPRSRELGQPEPPQPVVQARSGTARSRRPRGELRVADGVADRRRRADGPQAVPGRRAGHVGRRGDTQDVHHRRHRHDRERGIWRSRMRCRICPRTRRPARC